MKFSKGIGVAAGVAFAVVAGSGGVAMAKKPATASGNLNLRITGYEVLTPSAGSPGQYTVNGLGQVIGDSTGSLIGDLTYTLVDADAATENTCSDSLIGTITLPTGNFAQPNGSFTISLTLTAGDDATADCEGATIDLLCNRTLQHQNLVSELDAGTYHCIATGVTAAAGGTSVIDAASLDVTIGSVEGANAPTD